MYLENIQLINTYVRSTLLHNKLIQLPFLPIIFTEKFGVIMLKGKTFAVNVILVDIAQLTLPFIIN